VNARKEILRRFSDYPDHTHFDMVKGDADKNWNNFSFEPETLKNNNFKFAVLVPHTFVDNTEEVPRDFESYSYSFTQNKKEAQAGYMLQVSIQFSFSPVTMVITKENKPLARFVINLCAIVGGVFVVFGIVNSTV
jgi:hypothetical protein